MKSRLSLVGLSLLLTIVFSVSAQETSSTGSPRVKIASLEHSFGTVKPGTPLTHTFKVMNDGKANLEIKSVSPSCGCTTTNFDKVVAPGQTGGITLEVEKTEGYKGEVVKTATVTTNDPDRQTFTLTLRAGFSTE